MGRGGKVGSKLDFKKRARSKDKGSDDSDEDYVVSDEEDEVSEDELEDYCSSVDGYGSEESFDSLVEEEDKEEEIVVRLKARKSNLGNGKNGVKASRKRKRVSYEDEEEDEDYESEEEDEDEEFTPDEDDCFDEEDELVVTKKKKSCHNKKRKNNYKLGREGLRKKGSFRGGKRSKSMVSKKPLGNKGRRNRGLKKKERHDMDDDNDDDVDFIDDMVVVREKNKANLSRRKRRYVVPSDSDFASSRSSDYEYTISEEEREQVREANELFGSLKTNLRNSSSCKRMEEYGNVCQQRKLPGRKGKAKIEKVKSESGKQVCGICLSEEDKRRLRGTLNCCSHYFCFSCIMEWSKVESRCPLCKQRFKTIIKPERSTAGVDLRSVVIQVPERDQVYQPSEEDLRSYLDPYENVICSECHQGGDDGLMLLCDICDSSAHTYCVGLGRVVPEGNWYCDGCRAIALGSSSSQAQDPLPDQRTVSANLYNRPSPVVSFGEGLAPSLASSPHVPLSQGYGNLSSPRFLTGDGQAASAGAGAGASTLTGRRWIHRHIQNLLSINRMNLMAGSGDATQMANFGSEFLNSQADQGRERVIQPARAQETEPSHQAICQGRLPDHPSSSVINGDLFSPRLSHLRRQAVQDPTMATANGSVNLTLSPEFTGINSMPSYEQLQQCSGISNIVYDEGDFYVAKEQLQSIVKSHLKNLSRDIELDQSTFKDIASSSTHTILAACGLEHRSEVHIVHPPSICSHVERVAAGQTSLMKGHCSSCFDSFVRDVVKRIMDTRLPQWLRLGL